MDGKFRTIFLSINNEEDIHVLAAVVRKPENWLHKDGALFVLGSQALLVALLNDRDKLIAPSLRLKCITTMIDTSRAEWKMVLGYGFNLGAFPSNIPIGSRRTEEGQLFKSLIKASQEVPDSVACNGPLMSTLKAPCREVCCKLQLLVVNV